MRIFWESVSWHQLRVEYYWGGQLSQHSNCLPCFGAFWASSSNSWQLLGYYHHCYHWFSGWRFHWNERRIQEQQQPKGEGKRHWFPFHGQPSFECTWSFLCMKVSACLTDKDSGNWVGNGIAMPNAFFAVKRLCHFVFPALFEAWRSVWNAFQSWLQISSFYQRWIDGKRDFCFHPRSLWCEMSNITIHSFRTIPK